MSGRQHSTEQAAPAGTAPLREADRDAYDRDVILDRRGAEIGVSGSEWMQLHRAIGPNRDPRPSDVEALFAGASSVLAPPKSATAGRGRVATGGVAPSPAPATAPARPRHSGYRSMTADEKRAFDRAVEQGTHEGRLDYARRMGGLAGRALAAYEHVSYRVRTKRDTRTGPATESTRDSYKASFGKHFIDGF